MAVGLKPNTIIKNVLHAVLLVQHMLGAICASFCEKVNFKGVSFAVLDIKTTSYHNCT